MGITIKNFKYSGSFKVADRPRVDPTPVWQSNASLIHQNEGTSVSTTLSATAPKTITYSLVNSSTLPGTLVMNATTGAITGSLPRVSANASYAFDVRASTSVAHADQRFYANVINVPTAPYWITNAGNIFTANSGTNIAQAVVAAHIDNATVTYTAANVAGLPAGVTFNTANGVLTGKLPIVTSNTTYSFTANAVAEGLANSRTFSVTSLGVTANTFVLLNMESDTANSTTLTDSSQFLNTMTLGNCRVSASRAKYGTRSLAGSGYIGQGSIGNWLIPAQTNSSLARISANQDYTVEFWYNMQSQFGGSGFDEGTRYCTSFVTLYNNAINNVNGGGAPTGTGTDTFYIGTTPQAAATAPTGITVHVGAGYGTGGSYAASSSAVSMPFNTWHHVALVRLNNVHKLYVNGVSLTLSAPTDTTQTQGFGQGAGDIWQFGGNTYMYQGRYATCGFNLAGYMDDIRISKVARYTTNFTPTGPFNNL